MGKIAPLAILALIPVLGACVTSGGSSSSSSKTEAQWAYNACAKSYNDKFRFLEGPAAMVSGQDDGTYSCFWDYGVTSEAAINRAMASCRREFPRCYVFATDRGISDWAQAINDNDGTDPAISRRSRSGRSNTDVTKVLSGVLSGIAAGMQAGGSYQSQPTYGGYVPSPPSTTYGSSGGYTYGSGGGHTYGTSGASYGTVGRSTYGPGGGSSYGSGVPAYGLSGGSTYRSGGAPTYGLSGGSTSGSGSRSTYDPGANCGPGGKPRVSTGDPGATAVC